MRNRFRRLRAKFAAAEPGTAITASNLRLVSRLVSENARPYSRRYALSLFCMIIASACTALSAWIMEDVINEIFIRRQLTALVTIAASIAGIFLIKGLASYIQAAILAKIGNNVVARLQARIYGTILAQGLGFFRQRESSDMVARMTGNAQAAREALDMIFVSLGRDLLTLLALIGVMLSKDAVMTAIALASTPIIIFLITRLTARIRTLAEHEFRFRTEVIATLQETASGADVIKAFTLEPHMRLRALDAISGIETRNNKIARLRAQASPIMETLGGISFAAVILYGGYIVIERGVEPGAFFAFLTALLLAYEPAKKLSRLRVQLEHQLYGVRLMFDIIDTKPETSDRPGAGDLVVSKGRVELDEVRFTYPNSGGAALDGLSLSAEAGCVTALVGPSGAGKSTIFSLVERFFVPDSGRLLVDGTDLSTVTAQSLREQVALVTQETFLFAGTIRENLQLGRADARAEEVEQAARDAYAHDFIAALPDGYDTEIGERGVALAGGERQRLAIARAFLRNAPILLLDEPTSSLDAESEAHVQAALDRLMHARTCIVIAHRLTTVQNAHAIYVMKDGRVIQSGSHAALIAEGGLYERLHQLQFRSADPETA